MLYRPTTIGQDNGETPPDKTGYVTGWLERAPGGIELVAIGGGTLLTLAGFMIGGSIGKFVAVTGALGAGLGLGSAVRTGFRGTLKSEVSGMGNLLVSPSGRMLGVDR